MGALGLWLMAGVLIFSAVVCARIAYGQRPRAAAVDSFRTALEHERLVRAACADLDAEYRALTR